VTQQKPKTQTQTTRQSSDSHLKDNVCADRPDTYRRRHRHRHDRTGSRWTPRRSRPAAAPVPYDGLVSQLSAIPSGLRQPIGHTVDAGGVDAVAVDALNAVHTSAVDAIDAHDIHAVDAIHALNAVDAVVQRFHEQ
jgi:hypothetical protein